MSNLRRKRSSSTKTSAAVASKRRSSTKNIDFAIEESDDDNNDDESLTSNDDDNESMDDSSGDEEEKETVDEKRVRMAREFLSKMQKADDEASSSDSSSSDEDDDEDDDEEEIGADNFAKRLERERLKKRGTLERMLAKKVQSDLKQSWDMLQEKLDHINDSDAQAQAKVWVQNDKYKLCRGHDLTPTCVALHAPSGSRAYSASKDNSIIMWDVDTQSKLHTIVPRWNPNKCEYTRNSGEVLAMAASDDGRYLAVGGRDATVKIYDVRQKKVAAAATKNVSDNEKDSAFEIRGIATTFEGHKGPVTALTFRSKSLQLFSGSNDRCIRHYNLSELTYIETLYGHQAAVSGLSCFGLRHEVPFSVGRDRTVRAWKIAEESHLIFRGGAKLSSADCVSSIKDDWILTGHDDGVLNLWTMTKKKAVRSVENAHGEKGNIPRGIVSCASLGGSDLTVTGSNDGYIRLWNISTGSTVAERGVDPIGKIPVHGYINDIAIGPKARFCVAAVGQEPRLGRWDRIPAARNRFAIIPLRSNIDDDNNEAKNTEEESVSEEETPIEEVMSAADDSNEEPSSSDEEEQ